VKKLLACLLMAATMLSLTTCIDTPDVATQQVQQPEITSKFIPQLKCDTTTQTGKSSLGTGIIVGKNTILTADHVIGNKNYCTVRNKSRRLEITHRDNPNDFAILRSPTALNQPGFVVNCDPMKTGETYWLVGYAMGEPTISKHSGVATNRYYRGRAPNGVYTEHLRGIQGKSYPGMSGGPVVNSRGEAVAFVSAVATDGSNIALVKEFRDTEVCKRSDK
jgi:S1-C subfamily serine protease